MTGTIDGMAPAPAPAPAPAFTGVSPYLFYPDGDAAAEWLTKVEDYAPPATRSRRFGYTLGGLLDGITARLP
jgi:hypothetical protein